MKILLRFLAPYKKEVILGPFFKLIEAILELLLPTLMALLINHGVNQNNTAYVWKIGSLMLAMAVLGFGSSLVCQYYAARTSQGFGTTLRNAMFTHISSLSQAEINHFGTSTLINRITNDINQLQLAVAMMIRLVIRAPFIIIGASVMAMILDWRLGLILVGATPLFGLVLYLIISHTSPLYARYQKKMDHVALVLQENLAGVRIIRAFTKKEKEQQRFDVANDDLTATAIRVGKISSLLNPLTTFVMNATILVILWVGAIHINAGRLSQGEIIAFVNYLTQILLALIVVSNLVILFTKAYASAQRVSEVLNTESTLKDTATGQIHSDPEAPLLEFDHVSFGYNPGGDLALTDITVRIERGETIGIIGGTGSGKSTFVNLIPRFYEVNAGEIRYEGSDIRDLPLAHLRGQIALVPQKAVLFSGTITENIRWGKPSASDNEVVAAAKVAQADEFIRELPQGYQTPVARGGVNFSGGQRQRLTIARAVIAHSPVLILDDSSSALDYATDAALRRAIRQLSQHLTLLLVSQRVSTVRQADKILVFDEGRLIGCGSHTDLLHTCQVYREIVNSQLSETEGAQ